jgi:FAD/FMN-containing dehydrogenase
MPATSTNLAERLASVVGGGRVRGDAAALAGYAVDEVTPGAVVQPASAEEAAEIVRFAIAENLGVVPVGSRSKMSIGMPPSRYDIALDMMALNQIAHYDPGDLTLSVDAGCTLQSINAALTPQKQFLPLPQGFGVQCTVAGTIASGVDSHLRQFFGTARDFLIGAEFIDGTGARCKSGGRVVKNVTGYDLHKLLIGSLGTLAIITRLNFRTFPSLASAESPAEMFVAAFADAKSAVAFRQNIAASPFTPDAVELLSPELSELFMAYRPRSWERQVTPLGSWFSRSQWNVVIYFHGTSELRARYVAALTQLSESAGAGAAHTLQSAGVDLAGSIGGEAETLNALISETARFLRNASPGATIFKIAQLPAKLPELFAGLAEIAAKAKVPHAFCARGAGSVYFALLPPDPSYHLSAAVAAGALTEQEVMEMGTGTTEQTFSELSRTCDSIFAFCAKQSATAFIPFAPAALKRRVNVFGPERADVSAMRRLKSAFDPRNIFAPGRMPF